MIKIENIKKSFGKLQVLNGINLSCTEGHIYGLVGENGAGKTTLFKCIAGLENCEGKVNYSKGKLKNTLGFLPTEPYFFSKITGFEYLQLLCNARGVKITDLKKYNVFELPLDKYAENYSTGMKKKLAFTGVLLQENDVFILDEPFNGVDIQSNYFIREILLSLKEMNKIIILSSHIFSILNDICHEIHLVKNGEIIESAYKDQFQELEQKMINSSNLEQQVGKWKSLTSSMV